MSGPKVRGSELEENKLYDVFLKMRDLLEDYAPQWYPEALRNSVEGVVQRNQK